MRPSLVVRIVAVGWLAVTRPSAGATCPLGKIEFEPLPGPSYSAAAQRDTSAGNGDGDGTVRYDLKAGRVEVSVSAGPTGSFQSHGIPADEYQLVGPGVTPVSITARAHVTGDAESLTDGFYHGTIALWAVLEEQGGVRDSLRVDVGGGETRSIDQTLSITLSHAPAEPFRLSFAANAGASLASGHLAVQLDFVLPPALLVSSCQGYAGPSSVPTRQTSWGRLKARYR